MNLLTRTSVLFFLALAGGCGGGTQPVMDMDDDADEVDAARSNQNRADAMPREDAPPSADTGQAASPDAARIVDAAAVADGGQPDNAQADNAPPGGDAGLAGPSVDRKDPRLFEFRFKANEADPQATTALANQLAMLDTRVEPAGKLVVYLHGAEEPATTCGSGDHSRVLAGMGFHVFNPCYRSGYGVANCGNDIGGCRLEALEGIDHHPAITVTPPDSIERRVARGLALLATRNPQGDWGYFLDGDKPRWSAIVVSGISHGGSSSGLIGVVRRVDRVVMLSGPLDTNQAWLKRTPLTPIERFWGFTHTGDAQHPGHLRAFADMMLPGALTMVDGKTPPYGGSHRLVTSAATNNGHGSTAAGGSSPKMGASWVFMPVWRTMYGR